MIEARRWAAGLAFLLLTVGLHCPGQESYSVAESSFLPHRFYVGDPVELRLRLRAADAELKPPATLPASRWLVVDEVRCSLYRSGEWMVRVFFTTFKPGSHTLPAIDLGGLRLEGIKVETRSILGDSEQAKPAGLKGQLNLPGTYWKLTALVLALAAGPLGLYYALRLIRRAWASYRTLKRRLQPRGRILRELRRLLGRLDECSEPDFFSEIARLLREYFQGRLAVPAPMHTTEELRDILPRVIANAAAGSEGSEHEGPQHEGPQHEGPQHERPRPVSPQPAVSERIAGLLRRADWVRFGSYESSEEEMRQAVASAVDIVETIEGEMRRVER